MSRVKVTHGIDKLARQAAKIPPRAIGDMSRAVKTDVEQGTRAAKGIARRRAGAHGKNYYKRIDGDMTGILEGEWGPTGTVRGNAVGAGWRHGAGNADAAKSADIQAPRFQKRVGNLPAKWFWPR